MCRIGVGLCHLALLPVPMSFLAIHSSSDSLVCRANADLSPYFRTLAMEFQGCGIQGETFPVFRTSPLREKNAEVEIA